MKKIQGGFTLAELMMVIAIIAVLVVLAIPAYQNEISRVRAAAAVSELAVYRAAVQDCYSQRQTFLGCSAGLNGVPGIGVSDFPPTANVILLISLNDGVITAETGATTSSGGAALIYRATPLVVGNMLSWQNSGSVCHSVRGLRSGHGGCP